MGISPPLRSKLHLRPTLFVLILVNAYLELPLVIGSTQIPAFLLAALLLLVIATQPGMLKRADIVFIAAIFSVALVSAIFSPNWDDISSRIRAVAQITFSSILFVAVVRLVMAMRLETTAKILYAITIVITALTALERFTWLKEVSDEFRRAVYVGSYIAYDGDARDQVLVGYIRPKLFTSEPSLLALGFSVFATSALITARGRRAKYAILTCTGLMLYLVGSPIVLIPIFTYAFMLAGDITHSRRNALLASFAALSLLGILIFTGVPEKLAGRFSSERLSASAVSNDRLEQKSEQLRLVFPYLSTIDAITVNPIFGLGVGGKRSLAKYSTLTNDYGIAMGTNAMASIPIYFGIVGGIAFVVVVIRYADRFGASRVTWIPAVIMLANSMGGLETPRFWVYLALFFGVSSASSLRSRSDNAERAY